MNESEQYVVLWFTKPNYIFPMYILLFAGWEVRIGKTCDHEALKMLGHSCSLYGLPCRQITCIYSVFFGP